MKAEAITITNSGQQTQAMQQKSREFFGNKHVLDMPAFPTDTKDSEGIRGFVEQLLARLTDFLHMVRSQSHVLAVSPSLTFQLALTQVGVVCRCVAASLTAAAVAFRRVAALFIICAADFEISAHIFFFSLTTRGPIKRRRLGSRLA